MYWYRKPCVLRWETTCFQIFHVKTILRVGHVTKQNPRTVEDSGIFTTTGRFSILQQLKRNFWKIEEALFRISSSWKCETSLWKKYVLFRLYSLSTKSYRLRVTYFWYPPSHVSKRKTYFWTKPTQGPQRTQGFLPQQDEFYFTTAEKKLLEHYRCIVPNFTND